MVFNLNTLVIDNPKDSFGIKTIATQRVNIAGNDSQFSVDSATSKIVCEITDSKTSAPIARCFLAGSEKYSLTSVITFNSFDDIIDGKTIPLVNTERT